MTATLESTSASAKDFEPVDRVRMVEVKNAGLAFRATATDDGTIGTLVGFAAVFDSWTEIHSWEGHFLERFAPGSFAHTLAAHGDQVKAQWNHGVDPTVGEKPLGKPSLIEERDEGLWIEVPLDNTSYNRDLVASLRSGAVDGMSIRFRVDDDGQVWEHPRTATRRNPEKIPERTITRVALLYECSAVTWPAYTATSAGVRSWKVNKALMDRRAKRSGDRDRIVRLQARVLAVRVDIARQEIRDHIRKHGEPPSRREKQIRAKAKVAAYRVDQVVREMEAARRRAA
jgi:hypothetical protein